MNSLANVFFIDRFGDPSCMRIWRDETDIFSSRSCRRAGGTKKKRPRFFSRPVVINKRFGNGVVAGQWREII